MQEDHSTPSLKQALASLSDTTPTPLSTPTPPTPISTTAYPVTWQQHDLIIHRLIEGTTASANKALYASVFPSLIENREYVRVATSRTTKDSSAYDLYERHFSELTFSKVSVVELKYKLLISSEQLLTDKVQNSLLDTFFSTIPILQNLDRRYIGVADSLYWDTSTCALQSDTGDHRCFIKLFDTPKQKAVGGIQRFEPSQLGKDFSESLTEQYNKLLSLLRILPENCTFRAVTMLPPAENLHFILEWADGNQGVYWDILTMLATGFMDKKPLGGYFLIGLSRNGKSSCANLAHTLFGRNNTAMVCCSELGDYHKSATLRNCIMNIPDDEDDDINKYQREFKQLAAHQTLVVGKMNSQEPFEIPASQFTMIFPMNTLPTWKGSSASACSKRTLIIPFNRDFSKSDNSIGNFEERTFTPENLCTVAAHAMALATFFSERPTAFGFSDESKAQQQANVAENGSVIFYKEAFLKYFDGFASWSILYDDYIFWCKENEYRYGEKSSLKLAFKEYQGANCRRDCVYVTRQGKLKAKGRRIIVNRQKKLMLAPDAWLELVRMEVNSIHNSGRSAIAVIEQTIENRTNWMKQQEEFVQNKIEAANEKETVSNLLEDIKNKEEGAEQDGRDS